MDTTRSQSFSYDNLNRLSTAGDASHWSESYAYDNWGNMLAKSISLGSGYPFTSTSAPNNQNTTSLSYDSAGNVTADEFGNSFTYDANGRIITGGAGTYAYDGYGNRVEKTVGSTTTLYWPSSVIGVVDESNAGATSFGQQIFLAGLRVWSQDTSGNGRFLFTDHLGSTRVTANASGTVLDDIDYRGFGDIASNYGGSPTSNHYLYTGYESDDTENNTDFAQFRNHSAYMGRFSRPDPYDESYDPTNPQSLNRYSYVSNQPLNTIDPSGLLALNAAYYDINYDFFQLWGFGSWGPTFLQGAGGGGGGGGAGQNGPDKNGVYGHCDDPAKCKVTCVGGGVCFYQNDPPTKKDNCSTLAAYSVLMIPLGFPEGAGFFGLGGKIAGRVLGTIGAGLAIGGASCL
jgi:RHS repeat-associated protein